MRTSDPRAAVWTATANPAPPTPPLAGERRADVAVVGGGYTGLSAALHLAESGADVVLLEAEEPGFGASGRNHGQVVPVWGKHDPDAVEARLGPELGRRMNDWVAGSADLVFELIRKHRIDCTARQVGWLMPADSEARIAAVRRRFEQWAARGAPVRFLDRAETAALIGSDFWRAALLHERGGNIQPLNYARGLAAAALAAGAAVHGGSPALSLERGNGAWRIATRSGAVTAGQVILATNAYSDGLWPGLRRSIVPFRIFLAATRPLGDNIRRTILPGGHSLSDSRALLWPFRFDPGGRLVTGGEPLVTGGARAYVVRATLRRLRQAFPQIGETEIEDVWDGKVAMTLDRLPHYHEPAPGLHAALGYNGRGIGLATAMGQLLAARAAGAAAEMPLPILPVRPIPLHGLAVPAARAAMLLYNWRDWRASRAAA